MGLLFVLMRSASLNSSLPGEDRKPPDLNPSTANLPETATACLGISFQTCVVPLEAVGTSSLCRSEHRNHTPLWIQALYGDTLDEAVSVQILVQVVCDGNVRQSLLDTAGLS